MPSIKLHYSQGLVRDAVRAYWWRVTGWKFFLPYLVVLVSLGCAIWNGYRSWWVGLCGAILAFAGILAGTIYIVHAHGSIARLRRMRIPEAQFELGEERFRLSSDVGMSELAWSTITEVWRFPEFWLLFFSRAQFVILPTADLDSGARELLLSKIRANGAKIA